MIRQWAKILFALVLVTIALAASEVPETELFAPDINTTGAVDEIWSVSLTEPGTKNAVSLMIPPERIAGKKVLLVADVEQTDISEKPNHWNGVKLMLVLVGAGEKTNYLQASNVTGTRSWTTCSVAAEIPVDLKAARLVLGLENVSGTVNFRNVRIVEYYPVDYSGYKMTGSADKDNAEYAAGEEMVFTFYLTKDDQPTTGQVRLVLAADDGQTETLDRDFDSTGTVAVRGSLARPGFVMVKATLLTQLGSPATCEGRAIQYGLGGGVTPDTLRQALSEPADFDVYWKRQLEKLATVPVKALANKRVREGTYSIIYDLKISCIDAVPSSGYLAIPKNAKAKSLPLRMVFGGYSFQGADVREKADEIVFSVNPHGIENGREASYYQALEKGRLARYGFSEEENRRPETSYFTNMILRDLRSLDYARTLPEWDGETIVIEGGSQGAFRTLAVAALSGAARRCEIRVPWLCDLGGITIDRIRGWRPNWTEGLGYFDTVNFAKRVKCAVEIEAGLTDWVCPPSGIWVLYNNLTGSARLTMVQGLDHGGYPGFDAKVVSKTVYYK